MVSRIDKVRPFVQNQAKVGGFFGPRMHPPARVIFSFQHHIADTGLAQTICGIEPGSASTNDQCVGINRTGNSMLLSDRVT